MAYDDIIAKMFKEIASALKLSYKESTFHRTKSYILDNGKINFYFLVIIDPRNGNVIITSKNIHLRPYKKDELMSKAKKEIIIELQNIIKGIEELGFDKNNYKV